MSNFSPHFSHFSSKEESYHINRQENEKKSIHFYSDSNFPTKRMVPAPTVPLMPRESINTTETIYSPLKLHHSSHFETNQNEQEKWIQYGI